MASESVLKSSLIQYFSVQNLNPLFDHKPILLKISNKILFQTNKSPKNYLLEDRPLKYHWDNCLKKSYVKHLAEKSNHFVRHYENVSSDCRSNANSLIKDIVSSVQSLYIHNVDKVLNRVCRCKTNRNVYHRKQCFNKECLIKRKEMRFITKALNRNPNDSRLRQRFFNIKKHYKFYIRNLNVKMNKNYFVNLTNYIIQIQNLSGNY